MAPWLGGPEATIYTLLVSINPDTSFDSSSTFLVKTVQTLVSDLYVPDRSNL